MRYVSEQFKEKLNQVIRPPLKMWFEVSTAINRGVWFSSNQSSQNLDDFNEDVAPIVKTAVCTNEYYYAVVGDGKGVDDPNRICAAVKSGGTFPTPTHSVPAAVSKVASANSEILLGSTVQYYYNIVGIPYGLTLSFKGGLIPEEIRVEVGTVSGSSVTWAYEQTIYNTDLKEEIEYVALSTSDAGKWRRFYLKNTTKSGRYQFNYFEMWNYPWVTTVTFGSDYISSVSIDEVTDLTSQTMPSYDMAVVCLDPNGEYTPDTHYWEEEFSELKPCFLKLGYEIDGIVEYIDTLFGYLTAQPDYEQGKITFKVSVGFNYAGKKTLNLYSKCNNSLTTGALVDSRKFSDFLGNLFSSNDIIKDSTDENNIKTNHYEYIRNDARQLVANAVGGYITAGFNTVDLHDTCGVMYKGIDGYLPRYDQVKCSLQNRAKVGTIEITRNENRLSADYEDIEAVERVSLSANVQTPIDFVLPFWETGKFTLVDAQSSVPSATITTPTPSGQLEYLNRDGTSRYSVMFKSNVATTVKPIVRFFKVDSTSFREQQSLNNSDDEIYTNDNNLVTNEYVANRVTKVAQFMSDVSYQYEVDVVQDFTREVGDVIRLETEKGVYKTCVITALQFKLPGSNGHITCRKIFAIEDSDYAIPDVNNAKVTTYSGGGGITILDSLQGSCVIGKMKNTNDNKYYFFILGAKSTKVVKGGSTSTVAPNLTIKDENAHDWKVTYIEATNMTYSCPVVDLGDYDSTKVNNPYAYGGMTLIMNLYSEQGMTSPVSYSSTYSV